MVPRLWISAQNIRREGEMQGIVFQRTICVGLANEVRGGFIIRACVQLPSNTIQKQSGQRHHVGFRSDESCIGTAWLWLKWGR